MHVFSNAVYVSHYFLDSSGCPKSFCLKLSSPAIKYFRYIPLITFCVSMYALPTQVFLLFIDVLRSSLKSRDRLQFQHISFFFSKLYIIEEKSKFEFVKILGRCYLNYQYMPIAQNVGSHCCTFTRVYHVCWSYQLLVPFTV